MVSVDKKQVRSSLLLLLTAFIWGSSFVSQRVGMDYIGPLTFNCTRSFIGSIVLLPVILVINKKTDKQVLKKEKENKKALIIGGILCGTVLAVASSFQQFGIKYTTVGKTGFITALYMVIVPILGLFLKKKIRPIFWLSVALAVVGMYLLCITSEFSIQLGDFLVFICAIFFAVHIMVIDKFSPFVNGIKMSCIQFFVCGCICSIPMLIFETPTFSGIISAYIPLLYSGVMSCGVAYTLQIVAQKNANPVVASLIMSLESVFCALSGWLLLNEKLSARELIGCVIIFIGIIITQIPYKQKEKAEKTYSI